MSAFEKIKAKFGTYGDSDVRTLLHADHEIIRELSKEVADTQSAARRKALVRELKPLLVAHSRAEEVAVYTPLTQIRTSPDSRAAGSEGFVEHNLADIVLERLVHTRDAGSDMWKAHAKVLHEALAHHIDEEESKVFEELGEHFSDEEREAMGTEFIRGKALLSKDKSSRRPVPRKRQAAHPA